MALVLDGTTGIVSANIADGTIGASDLASGAITSTALPAGSVVQVVQFSTTATGTVGNSAAQAPGPFQASITPISATSKILIKITAHFGTDTGDARFPGFWVKRNGVDVVVGNKGGNNGTNVSFAGQIAVGAYVTMSQASFVYLDSPNSSSALTYALWWQADYIGGARINYFNRPHDLTDAMRLWTPSTMVLMEIAG